MALVKTVSGDYGLGLGSVLTLGRKRIQVYSNGDELISAGFGRKTPTKRRCSEEVREADNTERSLLEALPPEILNKILCGVDHGDLKQLFHVSRLIRKATTIAKESHFAYTTPLKIRAFRGSINLQNPNKLEDDFEVAPNAPKQPRLPRSRLCKKKLSDISVALFVSSGDRWPRKSLFADADD
ncbi:hypothetical protein Nepgr_028766 [Nepenthes gracilis]|uniref:F-box domain-containing protein n=1 Tax=Nepenthes gracilis TaxID=150966 RepID=A0AAD3Y2P6_NEPGR|nr:hypothetical protein Nepgr_028766 [Nepenthes gracilis]